MNYKNLIISGGGCKVFSVLGSLIYLRKKKRLLLIDTFIGCSAGNFPNLFLVLGCSIDECFNFSLEIYRNTFINENTITNLINHSGLIQGRSILNSVENIIEQKTGEKDITFKRLYQLTNKKITCVVTNMDTLKVNYLNYQNHPNFIVSEAIKASCSIPVIFTPSVFLKVYLSSPIASNKKKCKYLKKNIFYLPKMSNFFVGSHQQKIKITRNREQLQEIYFIIYYLKKWILVSVSRNTKNLFNQRIFCSKSSPLNIGDQIDFENKTYLKILDEITFSDGATLDNYPIHLSKKLNGPTLGIYFDSEKKVSKCNNSNILYYLKNIISGICNEIQDVKIRGFSKNSIKITLPNDINAFDLNPNVDNLKKIIRIGFLTTQRFLRKKNKKEKKNKKR
tara:strand:- start:3 stop:1181 length:1179 start_codon:yes stop_codon:yes gene_type:complete